MENLDFASLSHNLAEKIIDLRSKRRLTQEALALLSDVPRSTIAHLESGTGNPSLINLAKIATALNTSIEMLLTPPASNCRHVPAVELKKMMRSQGEVTIFKLLPENIHGMEIDKIEINPFSKMRGVPHETGTREFLHLLHGEMNVQVNGEKFTLSKGDVLAFPGDVQHSYENPLKIKSVALSVVAIAPVNSFH